MTKNCPEISGVCSQGPNEEIMPSSREEQNQHTKMISHTDEDRKHIPESNPSLVRDSDPGVVFSHELFSNIPPYEYWRLVIDGEQQTNPEESGWFAYEGRETGSVKSMMKAYAYMLTTVKKAPLTVELLHELHRRALGTVDIPTNNQFTKAGEFRSIRNSFGIIKGKNASEKGIEKLWHVKSKKLNFKFFSFTFLGSIPPKAGDTDYTVVPTKHPILHENIEMIINHFYKKIAAIHCDLTIDEKAKRKKKLKTIAQCIQNLELTHPFIDGNCRVICILVLNKLLLDYDFSPVIMTDPNRFDGFTPDELVEEIERGMETFKNLSSITPSTDEIIRNQLEANPGAFHLSIAFAIPEMVKRMLPYANVNHTNQYGKSALMLAALYGNVDVMLELLKYPEIDLNQQDQFGYTAEMWAREAGHMSIASLLQNDIRFNPALKTKFDSEESDIESKNSPETPNTLDTLKEIFSTTVTTSLLPYDQDIDPKERQLINGVNTLLRSKMQTVFSFSGIMYFYSALVQLTVPVPKKINLINELRSLVLSLDITTAFNKSILYRNTLQLISIESLRDFPYFDSFHDCDFNDMTDIDARLISIYENQLSNANELLLMIKRLPSKSRHHFANKHAGHVSWKDFQSTHIDRLQETLETFPEHKDIIFQAVLEEPSQFNRLINNNKTLCALARTFPQYTDSIYEKIAGHSEIFKQVIRNNDEFEKSLEIFSTHTDNLIHIVVDNPDIFKRLIGYQYELAKLVKRYPQYSDQLIKSVMDHPAIFNLHVDDSYSLDSFIYNFPQYADQCISLVFNQPNICKGIIRGNGDLRNIVKSQPQFIEKIINKLLKDEYEFKRLISDEYELDKTIKSCPHHAEALKEKFHRIVSNDERKKMGMSL